MLLKPKFYDTEKCIFLAFVSGHQKVHTQQNDNILRSQFKKIEFILANRKMTSLIFICYKLNDTKSFNHFPFL